MRSSKRAAVAHFAAREHSGMQCTRCCDAPLKNEAEAEVDLLQLAAAIVIDESGNGEDGGDVGTSGRRENQRDGQARAQAQQQAIFWGTGVHGDEDGLPVWRGAAKLDIARLCDASSNAR